MLIFLLCIISGFQLLGKSHDYPGYYNIFSDSQMRPKTEPFFMFLRLINDIFFNSSIQMIYLFCGFFGFIIKFQAIQKLSDYPDTYIPYLLTMFAFYAVHEYTQIRVACSIGIYMLAINDLYQRKKKSFYFKSIIAFLFHYSSITILVFYLFSKIKNKRVIIVLPILGFFFSVICSSIIGTQIMQLIQFIDVFLHFGKSGNISDFMSPFNLKYIVLLIAFVFYGRLCSITDDKNIILLKSYSFGLCVYYWLLPACLPVISVRIAEYFTSIFVIFILNISQKIKGKYYYLKFCPAVIITILYGYASFKTCILS